MYEKSSTEDEREKIREKVIYHDFGQIKYYQNCSKHKPNFPPGIFLNQHVCVSPCSWPPRITRQYTFLQCTELSDWIDEEAGPYTEVDILKSKLDELKALTKDLFARVEEHVGRPEILEALNSMVNSSEHFLAKAKNDTESKAPEDAYFTSNELELLEKKINETKTWIEEKMKVINAQPMHEFPNVNNKLIAVQGMDLDREVKYLVNKAKIAKQERDRLKREKELKEKEEKEKLEKEKEKQEKEKKKKAKKDKKAKDNATTEDENSDTTSNTGEDADNVDGK